jgi:hypothetical protein
MKSINNAKNWYEKSKIVYETTGHKFLVSDCLLFVCSVCLVCLVCMYVCMYVSENVLQKLHFEVQLVLEHNGVEFRIWLCDFREPLPKSSIFCSTIELKSINERWEQKKRLNLNHTLSYSRFHEVCTESSLFSLFCPHYNVRIQKWKSKSKK